MLPRHLPCLLLLLPLTHTGCAIGTFSVFDGSAPIRSTVEPDRALYREVGDGPAGALVLAKKAQSAQLLVLAGGETRRVKVPGGATGAQVVGDTLYSRSGHQVLRRDLDRSGPPEVVAEVTDLRAFRVSPSGDALLLATPEGVLEQREGTQRVLFDGKALAMAWDPSREAVWIASRAPLAVIDCLRLRDREVLHRVPLPLELESPSLQITLSGGNVVVHAHDRPVEVALLVAPDLGRATPLGSLWDPSSERVPDPRPAPMIPLGGTFVGERLSVRVPKVPFHFGQVAAYPGGRFLVADDRRGEGPSLWVIGRPRPKGVLASASRINAPAEWPNAIQGLASDAEGVNVVAGPYVLRVTPQGCSPEDPRSRAGDRARRVVNVLLNVPLATLEAAVFLPFNTLVSVIAVPVGLLVLPDEPAAGIALISSPLWFPIGMTLGLVDL